MRTRTWRHSLSNVAGRIRDSRRRLLYTWGARQPGHCPDRQMPRRRTTSCQSQEAECKIELVFLVWGSSNAPGRLSFGALPSHVMPQRQHGSHRLTSNKVVWMVGWNVVQVDISPSAPKNGKPEICRPPSAIDVPSRVFHLHFLTLTGPARPLLRPLTGPEQVWQPFHRVQSIFDAARMGQVGTARGSSS